MADSVTNAFEIERRGIMWTPLITLNDGVTSLGYDGDPNNVIDGNTPGESWLYSLPIGQHYKQSDATLWWKSEAPNVWINLSEGGGGGGEDNPPYTSNFTTSDWTELSGEYYLEIPPGVHLQGSSKHLVAFVYQQGDPNDYLVASYSVSNSGVVRIESEVAFNGNLIISNLANSEAGGGSDGAATLTLIEGDAFSNPRLFDVKISGIPFGLLSSTRFYDTPTQHGLVGRDSATNIRYIAVVDKQTNTTQTYSFYWDMYDFQLAVPNTQDGVIYVAASGTDVSMQMLDINTGTVLATTSEQYAWIGDTPYERTICRIVDNLIINGIDQGRQLVAVVGDSNNMKLRLVRYTPDLTLIADDELVSWDLNESIPSAVYFGSKGILYSIGTTTRFQPYEGSVAHTVILPTTSFTRVYAYSNKLYLLGCTGTSIVVLDETDYTSVLLTKASFGALYMGAFTDGFVIFAFSLFSSIAMRIYNIDDLDTIISSTSVAISSDFLMYTPPTQPNHIVDNTFTVINRVPALLEEHQGDDILTYKPFDRESYSKITVNSQDIQTNELVNITVNQSGKIINNYVKNIEVQTTLSVPDGITGPNQIFALEDESRIYVINRSATSTEQSRLFIYSKEENTYIGYIQAPTNKRFNSFDMDDTFIYAISQDWSGHGDTEVNVVKYLKDAPYTQVQISSPFPTSGVSFTYVVKLPYNKSEDLLFINIVPRTGNPNSYFIKKSDFTILNTGNFSSNRSVVSLPNNTFAGATRATSSLSVIKIEDIGDSNTVTSTNIILAGRWTSSEYIHQETYDAVTQKMYIPIGRRSYFVEIDIDTLDWTTGKVDSRRRYLGTPSGNIYYIKRNANGQLLVGGSGSVTGVYNETDLAKVEKLSIPLFLSEEATFVTDMGDNYFIVRRNAFEIFSKEGTPRVSQEHILNGDRAVVKVFDNNEILLETDNLVATSQITTEKITTEKITIGKYDIVFNETTDELEFVYNE